MEDNRIARQLESMVEMMKMKPELFRALQASMDPRRSHVIKEEAEWDDD